MSRIIACIFQEPVTYKKRKDGVLMVLMCCKVMEVLMSLQGSEMEADDPTTSYMLQVCSPWELKQKILCCLLNCTDEWLALLL